MKEEIYDVRELIFTLILTYKNSAGDNLLKPDPFMLYILALTSTSDSNTSVWTGVGASSGCSLLFRVGRKQGDVRNRLETELLSQTVIE